MFAEIPSWFGWFVAPAAGLGLIGWDVWDARRKRKGSPLAIEPSASQAEIAADPLVGHVIPDWPIRNLFFHIRPDLVDDSEAKAWKTVGDDVKDKFSVGSLQVWGREIDRNSQRLSLVEIDKKFWAHARFSYWFLAEGHEVLMHAETDSTSIRLQYADLRVNRSQALALWPKDDADAQFEKAFHRAAALKGSRESAKLVLAQLREEGVVIRNHPQSVGHMLTTELEDWIASITEWMEEAMEAIKTFDAADALWFRTLGEVPDPRVGIPNIRLGGKEERARYIKAFREHDYRLARLDKLFRKYGIGG